MMCLDGIFRRNNRTQPVKTSSMKALTSSLQPGATSSLKRDRFKYQPYDQSQPHLSPQHVLDWDTEQCQRWLKSRTYDQLAHIFDKNSWTGCELVSLDQVSLQQLEIDVSKIGAILLDIRQLQHASQVADASVYAKFRDARHVINDEKDTRATSLPTQEVSGPATSSQLEEARQGLTEPLQETTVKEAWQAPQSVVPQTVSRRSSTRNFFSRQGSRVSDVSSSMSTPAQRRHQLASEPDSKSFHGSQHYPSGSFNPKHCSNSAPESPDPSQNESPQLQRLQPPSKDFDQSSDLGDEWGFDDEPDQQPSHLVVPQAKISRGTRDVRARSLTTSPSTSEQVLSPAASNLWIDGNIQDLVSDARLRTVSERSDTSQSPTISNKPGSPTYFADGTVNDTMSSPKPSFKDRIKKSLGRKKGQEVLNNRDAKMFDADMMLF